MKNEGRALAKLSCALDGIYWTIAKESGIKENLFWLLYALDDEEIHTQKQICAEWLFPKTTINTLIKECERLGYVALVPIPGRGRELQITLTDAGRAYADQVLSPVRQIEAQAVKRARKVCSPTFVEDFSAFTQLLQEALGQYQERRP